MSQSRWGVGSNQYQKKPNTGAPELGAESDVRLDLPAYDPPVESHVVISATGDELDDYVTHPDWHVRADAASNPHLNDEQARFLADSDEQPVGVRASLALSMNAGHATMVADDPSPTVRHLAQTAWDIDPETRDRLERDVEVNAIRSLLR